jgi:hypothetical protein
VKCPLHDRADCPCEEHARQGEQGPGEGQASAEASLRTEAERLAERLVCADGGQGE